MHRFVLQRWASFCWDEESNCFTDPQFFLYLRTTDGTSCTLVLFVNTSFSCRGASGLTFCRFRSCHSTSPWLIQLANDTDGVIWLCSSGTRCKGKIKHPTLIQTGHSVPPFFDNFGFYLMLVPVKKEKESERHQAREVRNGCERATSTFLIEHGYLGSCEPLRCEVLLSPHQELWAPNCF